MCQADLEDVYYAPGVHVRLLSLGKLEGQGWGVRFEDGCMVLKDRDGELFAIVSKVNNVYPVELSVVALSAELAAWTDDRMRAEPTHLEVMERLDGIAMQATARGGEGSAASLMTWDHQLGHPSFKTIVDLANSGVSGMTITDVPTKSPALDECTACLAGKSVH